MAYPEGFQYMYVSHNGHVVENHKPSSGHYIEVVGSPATTHSGLYTVSTGVHVVVGFTLLLKMGALQRLL